MPAATIGAVLAPLRRRPTPGSLPGFGLSLGITLMFVSVIVVLPLTALVLKASGLGLGGLLSSVSSPRVVAALKLSFGAALIAAVVNTLFGFAVAWTLVRYRVPGRRILDAVVDLPFAIPTAVTGLSLTALYAPNGWLGEPLAKLGVKVAFGPIGLVIALIVVGLPFAVRAVQPALADLEREREEAAAALGADRWQTFRRVLLPAVMPSVATGFGLSFARALGEYGSVVFISGNMPMKTEIAPVLIVGRLEQYDYRGAAAIAVVMLVASFVILLSLNLIERWSRHRGGEA
jgi:sulfate transport system permease protein